MIDYEATYQRYVLEAELRIHRIYSKCFEDNLLAMVVKHYAKVIKRMTQPTETAIFFNDWKPKYKNHLWATAQR